MNLAQYTTLTLEHIGRNLLKEEKSLMKTKWWDYRRLHPMEATYLFAEAYKQAKRSFVMHRYDLYKGLNTKGLKNENFLKCSKQVISGMWKARQTADRLGIRYDFYCSRAFKYADRHLWKNMPQPCHLYSEKVPYQGGRSMIEDIGVGWLDHQEHQILIPEDSFYLVSNYKGHKDQKAFMVSLLQKISKRPNKPVALCTLVYESKVLAESVVRSYFKNDADCLLADAKRLLSCVNSPES